MTVARIANVVLPEPIRRTRDDIRAARAEAATLSIDEVRYLVDLYYETQDYRISAGNQVRALSKSEEPIQLLGWVSQTLNTVEKEVLRSLDYYTQQETTGLAQWARAVPGIGPVLTAGLLAHVNIEYCKTIGQLWRFAGLDPTSVWNKGEKRPWNARLKLVCYKIGESFVKVQSHERDVYGRVYLARKEYENRRNDAGDLADQAQRVLATKRIRTSTDAYKAYSQGKLPPAHIHARATRYAVKLFLAHYHEVGTWLLTGQLPPTPYALAHLDHVDDIAPPFLDLVPGLADARAASAKTASPGPFADQAARRPMSQSEMDG